MRCGACGAAMVGHGGKQRYRYYICGNARRKGREVCSSPLLPKNRIEGLVIDRIKDYVLAEDNLQELVRLTNEELARASDECRKRLELLDDQIAEVDSRLGRLYDALETGDFKGGVLAPRIKALVQKKEELQQAKAEAEEALRYQAVDIIDPQVVREYVGDLRGLLDRSSIIEQRSFLKSFVDGIEVCDSEVNIYYTIPVPPDSTTEETVGVVPIVHHG
jgi:site-specific DNA recombinase